MEPLRELIRRLPPGVEFLLVITWAFGLPIFSSILTLGTPTAGVRFTDATLVANVLYELMLMGFLLWFLHVRGWTLEKVGLRVDGRGTLWGVALLAVCYALTVGVELIASWLSFDLAGAIARMPRSDGRLSMEVVFLASVVNGVFEELFVAGYAITALTDKRGLWTAINVTTLLRMLCHLYQGPFALLTLVPMGLLFGYTYARTRLLWPLIVAHVLLDIVGLSIGAKP